MPGCQRRMLRQRSPSAARSRVGPMPLRVAPSLHRDRRCHPVADLPEPRNQLHALGDVESDAPEVEHVPSLAKLRRALDNRRRPAVLQKPVGEVAPAIPAPEIRPRASPHEAERYATSVTARSQSFYGWGIPAGPLNRDPRRQPGLRRSFRSRGSPTSWVAREWRPTRGRRWRTSSGARTTSTTCSSATGAVPDARLGEPRVDHPVTCRPRSRLLDSTRQPVPIRYDLSPPDTWGAGVPRLDF